MTGSSPPFMQRVLLRINASPPNPVAVSTAMALAQAMHAKFHALLIEDQRLSGAVELNCTRAFTLQVSSQRTITAHHLVDEMRRANRAVQRHLRLLAQDAKLEIEFEFAEDTPEQATCQACSPGTVLAFSSPLDLDTIRQMHRLLDEASEIGGFLIVGPGVKRASGPIIVAVENTSQQQRLVNIAARIRSPQNSDIIILPIGDSPMEARALGRDAQSLKQIYPDIGFANAQACYGEASVAIEALRRMKGGLIIAGMSGLLMPQEGSWRHIAAALECPMLLMR